jgi:hypothetical protein
MITAQKRTRKTQTKQRENTGNPRLGNATETEITNPSCYQPPTPVSLHLKQGDNTRNTKGKEAHAVGAQSVGSAASILLLLVLLILVRARARGSRLSETSAA